MEAFATLNFRQSIEWLNQSFLWQSIGQHTGQSCSVQSASVGPTATGFSGCWPCRAPRKRGKDMQRQCEQCETQPIGAVSKLRQLVTIKLTSKIGGM